MKEKQYRPMEKGILADLADWSLRHGPVELTITKETEDGGFAPAISVRKAPDGVLRRLVEDDRVADLSLEYGDLTVLPGPEGLDAIFGQDAAATHFERVEDVFDRLERDGTKGHARKKDLSRMSWLQIAMEAEAAVAETGRPDGAADVFALGATKPFTLKNGERLMAQIIGFGHDVSPDGQVAPITWDLVNTMEKEQPMNEDGTNAGSWPKSWMRTWLNGELLERLPDDLQAVIRPVVKLTSTGKRDPDIISTVDRLFLKSEWEQMGRAFHSVPGEGKQYAFYAREGQSWKQTNSSGGAAIPWFRSPSALTGTGFCNCDSDGTATSLDAAYTFDVCFGFAI